MSAIAGWVATQAGQDEGVLADMVEALGGGRRAGEALSGVVDRNRRRSAVMVAALSDPAASVSVALDGSIANGRELRTLLGRKGYAFRTPGDAEVVLRAYQYWDKEAVKHLRGAFAFALWDARKDRLVLARDRFGEKPLYLHERGTALYFASEAKGLLKVPGLKAEADLGAVRECLARGYVPGPRTLFRGIRKLPPATTAIWSMGRLQELRYWIAPDRAPHQEREIPDAVGGFVEKLGEAVKLRAGGGVFLSGGLDSAAMVAVLSREGGGSLRTFTLGFEGDKDSELPGAAEVAKHFATNHMEVVVAPKDLIPALESLVASRDAPVPRPSELAVHHLASVAARSVRTVLTGDGCDEVLGGYRRHVAERFAPGLLGFVPTGTGLPEGFFTGETEKEKKAPPFDADPRASRLRRALYFDQVSRLPEEQLERNDRAGAGNGVELRMPYLDHALVEHVSSLPDDRRVRGLATKWILREAGRGLIPASLASRRKAGFRMPIRDWLRNELRDTLLGHLRGAESITRRYYDAAALDRMLDEHLQGKNNHARPLWTLLNLEIWHRRYARG